MVVKACPQKLHYGMVMIVKKLKEVYNNLEQQILLLFCLLNIPKKSGVKREVESGNEWEDENAREHGRRIGKGMNGEQDKNKLTLS